MAPENTLAAARKALELGAQLWETDLAVTKDGELILFHDDSLARTTDVRAVFPERPPGPFTDFTLAEIRRLDAGSWFEEKDPHKQIASGAVSKAELRSYRGEKVPTLREALELTRDAGWRMNLELKKLPESFRHFPVVDRVLSLVKELKLDPKHLALSSGEHEWLKAAREKRPDIEMQALIGLWPNEPVIWGDMRFSTYNVRHTHATLEELRDLVAKGYTINLYVVNRAGEMRRFLAAGVHGLITDYPQLLAGIAAKKRGGVAA